MTKGLFLRIKLLNLYKFFLFHEDYIFKLEWYYLHHYVEWVTDNPNVQILSSLILLIYFIDNVEL